MHNNLQIPTPTGVPAETHSRGNRVGRQGVALVIVLSFVVLITGVVVAFFTLSTLQHQVSSSSASQTTVELFARGALNATVGDLQQEIIAGSSTLAPTQNPAPSTYSTVYLPTAAINAKPELSGTTGATGTENLLKRSARSTPFYTDNVNPYPFGVTRAAASATTTASVNGRSVTLARWNKPLLLAIPSSNSSADLTPVAAFSAPDWILVNNAGGNPTAWSTNMVWSSSASNSTSVVGRYAYAIYDEGGLLDANVAGYPAPTGSGSTTGTNYVYKNAEAFADLTQLGLTQNQVNDLVGWRNNASLSLSGTLPTSYGNYASGSTIELSYLHLIKGNTNGFLMPANTTASGSNGTTDHQFATRQSLIDFLVNGIGQSGTGVRNLQIALQYLGTFTREINAPTYTPAKSRPTVQPGYPGNGLDPHYNPSLINDVRVVTSFTRYSDATQAVVGEPLIKYRFPLNRLALFGNSNGMTGGVTSDIYKYFGLTRSSTSTPWVYNHDPTAVYSGTIMTLEEVAAAGREPDFFELLQAGVALGSLGQYYNTIVSDVVTSGGVNLDKSPTNQVIQIGANIMDQYDTDSYPTAITLGTQTFYGLECLPYMTQIYNVVWTSDPANVPPSFWYQPKIWNPQVAVSSTAVPASLRFRVVKASGADPYVVFADQPPVGTAYAESDQTLSAPIVWPDSNTPNSPSIPASIDASSASINFTPSNNNSFQLPALLTATQTGMNAKGNNVIGDPGKNLGVFVGQAPSVTPPRGLPYVNALDQLANSEVYYILEYLSADSSTWIRYDQIRNRRDAVNGGTASYGLGQFCFPLDAYKTLQHNYQVVRSDPRSDRFGMFVSIDGSTPLTIRPGVGDGGLVIQPTLATSSPGWTNVTDGNCYIGDLSDNLAGSWTHYTDPDGVLRPGLGAYTAGGPGGANGITSSGGYPLASDFINNPISRPVVLNRPFRSVADMGYASRGAPWKNVDFFSNTTGDAALLDLFCVDATPASLQLQGGYNDLDAKQTAVPMRAGALDLNTRQPLVVQAMLAGAIKQEATTTPTMIDPPTDAASLANSLVTLTKATPLTNRGELASIWSADLNYASKPDNTIKARREAAIRALADVGNTRTWNLLIDIIAQTGRYPINATKLDQFNVEGEHRYWLHVAIDRYTGKVVSQNLESVYE